MTGSPRANGSRACSTGDPAPHPTPPRLDLRRARNPRSGDGVLVAAGCSRLSEIAARMGKPAGALTRPLADLIALGYLRKEVPFGEDGRSSKRTLYRIVPGGVLVSLCATRADAAAARPVRTGRGRAEYGLSPALCRNLGGPGEESVPRLRIGGIGWGPASRWCGNGRDGPTEFDVVAESLDGDSILVGEAKGASRPDVARWRADLRARASPAPFLRGDASGARPHHPRVRAQAPRWRAVSIMAVMVSEPVVDLDPAG